MTFSRNDFGRCEFTRFSKPGIKNNLFIERIMSSVIEYVR
jgi:hypothetical protein